MKCTVSGKPQELPDEASVPRSERREDGQHFDHFVMCDDEMAKKGFIRPVRLTYKHLICGGITRMPQACAETYACNPGYYGSTFCCHCRDYFPVGPNGEFLWEGTNEKVGS
jgi:hypothetical protein